MFRHITHFYGEELLAARPPSRLEDYPFPAVRDCLLNVFAASLHNWGPFLHPQPGDAPYLAIYWPLELLTKQILV
jgi:hypothetical protein